MYTFLSWMHVLVILYFIISLKNGTISNDTSHAKIMAVLVRDT